MVYIFCGRPCWEKTKMTLPKMSNIHISTHTFYPICLKKLLFRILLLFFGLTRTWENEKSIFQLCKKAMKHQRNIWFNLRFLPRPIWNMESEKKQNKEESKSELNVSKIPCQMPAKLFENHRKTWIGDHLQNISKQHTNGAIITNRNNSYTVWYTLKRFNT